MWPGNKQNVLLISRMTVLELESDQDLGSRREELHVLDLR
jgi:hypothetical protein